ARVEEALGDDTMEIVKLPPDPLAPQPKKHAASAEGPLVGIGTDPPSRTYAVVGISTRGKKGPVSKRVVVPLAPPPPPPAAPTIPSPGRETGARGPTTPPALPATDAVLPPHSLGPPPPTIEYNVYDATDPQALVKLTAKPVADAKYTDTRITWGTRRC